MKKSENKVLAQVKDDFNSAKQFRAGKESKWTEFYKLYRAYLDESRYPWRSNLFIPYSFWTIETIVPRLVARKPKLLVLPREEKDEQQADIIEELIDYEWKEIGMDQIIEDMAREGLKYGTSFVKVGWDQEAMMPKVENIDILDLYVDPYATSIEDARFVIFRTFKSKEEIKANPNYKNTAQLEGLEGVDKEGNKSQRYAIQKMSDPTASGIRSEKKIEIIEHWTKDSLKVVAAEKIVLRDDENPFKDNKIPFVVFKDYPVAFEFYGIGEIEHLESLQNEANSIRNQILDANNLIINPMYEVDPTSNVNIQNLISKPGAILQKGLKPVRQPILPAHAFQLERDIKNDVQQTTGVTDYQIGGTSERSPLNKTATGVSLIQEAGNQRFKLKIRHLENSIKELGSMLLARNQQYMVKTKTIRIIGEKGLEFKKIKPKDIGGNYDIIPEAGSTEPVDKTLEIAKMKDFMLQLSKIQQTGQINVRWYELAKKLADKYDIQGIEDIIQETQPAAEEEVAPEVITMLNKLGPEGTAEEISKMSPADQEIMKNQLAKLGGQYAGGNRAQTQSPSPQEIPQE